MRFLRFLIVQLMLLSFLVSCNNGEIPGINQAETVFLNQRFDFSYSPGFGLATLTLNDNFVSSAEFRNGRVYFDVSLRNLGGSYVEYTDAVVYVDGVEVSRKFLHVLENALASSELVVFAEGIGETEFISELNQLNQQNNLSDGFRLVSGSFRSLSSGSAKALVTIGQQSTQEALSNLNRSSRINASPNLLYGISMRSKYWSSPRCDAINQLRNHSDTGWKLLRQTDILQILDADQAHASGIRGGAITIPILDTGLNNGDIFDCNPNDGVKEGHGTHIYNLAQAIAPDATMRSEVVCSSSGFCSTEDLVTTLIELEDRYLTLGGKVIINLSISGDRGIDSAIDKAIWAQLRNYERNYSNFLAVAAAGNQGLSGDNYAATVPAYPASFSDVIQANDYTPLKNILSVGTIGIKNDGTLALSDLNPKGVAVDLVAPGIKLCLDRSNGCAPDGSTKGLTGSSFATAVVTGVAALAWSACPNLSAQQLRQMLKNNASNIPGSSFGLVNADPNYLTKCAGGNPSPTDPPVKEAPILGTIPTIVSADKVGFEIQVVPLDQNKNVITEGVKLSDFSFRNIKATRKDTLTFASDASAAPTKLTVDKPTGSQGSTIVMDFDSSGSMEDPRRPNDPERLRVKAGKELINRLGNLDQVAILEFSSSTRLLQDFTTDKVLLRNAIDKVRSSGSTYLYTSLLNALERLRIKSGSNPSIVVLTDGEADDRRLFDSVVSTAKTQNTPIFVIGLGKTLDFSELEKLASETRGAFAKAEDATKLEALFSAVGVGISQGRIVVTGEGTFSTLLAPGTYEIDGILTTQINGGKAETQFKFEITVLDTGVNQAPSVSITQPTAGASISSDLLVSGVATDDKGITKLSYQLNSNAVVDISSSLSGNNYSFSISSSLLQVGSNTLRVTAQDAERLTDTKTVTFTYQPISPSEKVLISNRNHVIAVADLGDALAIRIEAIGDTTNNFGDTNFDFSAIHVDVNQNGVVDDYIDVVYSVRQKSYNTICPFYKYSDGTNSFCDAFASDASLSVEFSASSRSATAHPIWTYTIPKSEIVTNGSSSFIVEIFSVGVGGFFYPPDASSFFDRTLKYP